MHFSRNLLLLSLMSLSPLIQASETADAAATCLTDNTSGKDRKDLVRWMFLALAKHPALVTIAAASPEQDEHSNQAVGALFTRLIAVDCPKEMRALIAESGPTAIASAFEVLGKVAAQELMAHPDVASAMGKLDKYIDTEKIAAISAAKK